MFAKGAVAVVGAIMASLAGPVVSVHAAGQAEVVFSSTGAQQSWTVPTGVTSVHIVVVGGHGGASESTARPGGSGRRIEGDLPVTPSTVMYIEVGGNGGTGASGAGGAGGFNGGAIGGSGGLGAGGGGGASDIRTIPRAQAGSLGSRLVVAGGGGGAGTGGDGGNGAAAGESISGRAFGGEGGTSDHGGAGGFSYLPDQSGGDGSTGKGGAGASRVGPGGGGAGGWYGGGGGGADQDFAFDGAGGGGGSDRGGPILNGVGSDDATGIPTITITYTDSIAPTTTAPVASVASGSTISGEIPVRLTWTAADTGSGIDHSEVWLSTNGGAYALVGSPTGGSYTRSMTPSAGTAYRFKVRAFDKAGNVSGFAAGLHLPRHACRADEHGRPLQRGVVPGLQRVGIGR